jgi:hypothetical protein
MALAPREPGDPAMKFRFLIIDEAGNVTGTNNEAQAIAAAELEVVVDCQEGQQINHDGSGERVDIVELDESDYTEE